MRHSKALRTAEFLASTLLPLAALTGCGMGTPTVSSKGPSGGNGTLVLTGSVHGGQQPVAGAALNIYAAGTANYGSAATSLLKSGVTVISSSDGSGSFVLTGKYTCASPEQRVYLVATGGNAGAGTNNALALMAALGRCGDLTSTTFININEVTTVASVWALAPFMAGATNIGGPTSNTGGLNNAFADVNTLTNISTGNAGGAGVPSGTVLPITTINTLADIIAACINSNGSGSACSTLFAGTTVGGNVPTDTITAAMNMAQHPSSNVGPLFSLVTPGAPFQPTLVEAPSDFTLAATFAPGLSTPSAVAADASGNVWVTDSSSNKAMKLSHTGAPALTVTGLSAPAAVALDQSGNAWVANSGNSTLAMINSSGAVSTFSGGGLSSPRSVSVDGLGNVWVVNGGGASVSAFNNSGVALSNAGYFDTAGQPVAVGTNPN